jgi:flagellar biosynthetic protein FliP
MLIRNTLDQMRYKFFRVSFWVPSFIILCLCSFVSAKLQAQTGLPLINITEGADGDTEYSLTLQVLLLMSALTLLPSVLIMMTSFIRVIIVLSLLRQALGTAQTPPNQVLVGIALFLSLYIMSPVLTDIYDNSLTPLMAEEISQSQAIENATVPLRNFMLNQTREDDMNVFMEMAQVPLDTAYEDVSLSVLIPAFMTSELKTAFTIGFLIYIPFVIIDLVVASVLMSMGMMMLSPMMISMPFKLMLFVLADGWLLIMQSITTSFMV